MFRLLKVNEIEIAKYISSNQQARGTIRKLFRLVVKKEIDRIKVERIITQSPPHRSSGSDRNLRPGVRYYCIGLFGSAYLRTGGWKILKVGLQRIFDNMGKESKIDPIYELRPPILPKSIGMTIGVPNIIIFLKPNRAECVLFAEWLCLTGRYSIAMDAHRWPWAYRALRLLPLWKRVTEKRKNRLSIRGGPSIFCWSLVLTSDRLNDAIFYNRPFGRVQNF